MISINCQNKSRIIWKRGLRTYLCGVILIALVEAGRLTCPLWVVLLTGWDPGKHEQRQRAEQHHAPI